MRKDAVEASPLLYLRLGPGRTAGALYFVVVLTGLFCLAYVPSRVPVAGDPQAVLGVIADNAALWRLRIAAFLVMQVAFLLLPLALYCGLSDAGRATAALMVAFVAVSVPVSLAAVSELMLALQLAVAPGAQLALPVGAREAAAWLALERYRQDLQVAQVFWGLWLLPLGWLALASRRLPRVLAILLLLGGVGYLVKIFGGLLVPDFQGSALSGYVTMPAALGEIGTCLWLIVFGLRSRHGAGQAPAAPG